MPQSKTAAKPITQKRLMNIALYYLGRYESSAGNLHRLLERRIAKASMKGAEIPPQASGWVDLVVSEMCRLGYVNDERFAASVVEKYRSAGKSERYIRQKLALAGIETDVQNNALQNSESDFSADAELTAALRLVEKRRLGRFRAQQDRKAFRKKDLAVLARAGFSFQTAVQALGSNGDDDDEYPC